MNSHIGREAEARQEDGWKVLGYDAAGVVRGGCLFPAGRFARFAVGRCDGSPAGGGDGAGHRFTFSIATGIGLGFMTYVGVKGNAGRWREIGGAVWVVAVASAAMLALE
ncbi:hypothetical protein [Xanthobacter agilis]|uniref:Uncharacterized protein n=1 Tax=Xanthobacter agilis TaxID=47492 RepID=A0ABU0LBP2_XANAG|nr:hypothetical protein [Xanthobacter agilis]MDQ0504559.1 hypothetical protein [Xanthobacter agilis]